MTKPLPISVAPSPNSKSIAEQESKIHTLNVDKAQIQASINLWNKWYLGCLVVTLIAGAGSLATTRALLKKADVVTKLDGDIQSLESSVADMRRQDFETDLKVKDVEIGKALENAAQATSTASTANQNAEDARVAQSKLEKDNLVLQSQVEQEKIERLKVEAKYAPRRLDAEQKKELTDALIGGSFYGVTGGKITVDVFLATSDGIPYATDIIEAINAAPGWQASFGAQTAIGGNLRGVVLLVKDQQSAPRWVAYLQQVLKKQGIGGDATLNPAMQPGDVELLIAPKL